MPTLTLPIDPDYGAIVSASIGLPQADVRALRRALKPVPQPETVRAMLDTGAECTLIDPSKTRLFTHLGGPYTDRAEVRFVWGSGLCLCYSATIVIHGLGRKNDLKLEVHPVLEYDLRGQGFDLLIGRDFLTQYRFLFDGPAGTFTLDY